MNLCELRSSAGSGAECRDLGELQFNPNSDFPKAFGAISSGFNLPWLDAEFAKQYGHDFHREADHVGEGAIDLFND